MATIKKDMLNLDITLVKIKVVMKGFRQEIEIYTKVEESMDFVDWLNNNKALQSTKIEDKEKFTNKYFIFNDYKKKATICINRSDIKYFEIPFYNDLGEDLDFKVLQYQC